jgi:DNA phosphorothioation-dependent restriction protein DptG
MPKTIEFHNTPQFTREFVNNWLTHVIKHKDSPTHIAVLEDVLQLIDVALTVLEPGQTAPGKTEQT